MEDRERRIKTEKEREQNSEIGSNKRISTCAQCFIFPFTCCVFCSMLQQFFILVNIFSYSFRLNVIAIHLIPTHNEALTN